MKAKRNHYHRLSSMHIKLPVFVVIMQSSPRFSSTDCMFCERFRWELGPMEIDGAIQYVQ